MQKRLLALAACTLTLGLAARSRADELGLGDPAPPLNVSAFVKGEKVEKFEPGKVYVVEFWATWCGPCKVSIPHLTELQEKNKDVTFIGVSVFENDPKLVEPFVEEMGDRMNYRVAKDDVEDGERAGKMAKDWMEASGEGGIPAAFIVNKQGRIAWIGHPMNMEAPLVQVINDTFDLEKAASERRKEKANEKRTESLFRALATAEGPKAQLKLLDAAIAEDPSLEAGNIGMIRFSILCQTDEQEKIAAAAKTLMGVFGDNPQALNAIAWPLIDPARQGGKPTSAQIELAVKAAAKANELTKGEDCNILDTHALAVYLSGDKARALELEEQAVKKAGDQVPPAQLSEMKERLEKFRKEAGK